LTEDEEQPDDDAPERSDVDAMRNRLRPRLRQRGDRAA
jgi:hypothetical protein